MGTLSVAAKTTVFVVVGMLHGAPGFAADCETDKECSAYEVCTAEGACVARSCEKDIECPDDGLCEAGVCSAPGGASLFSPAPVRPIERSGSQPDVQVSYVEREVKGIPALWMSGLVVTGLSWVTTVGLTAGVCEDDCGRSIAINAIPVVGPIIGIASDVETEEYAAALIVASLFQATGVALVAVGLTAKRTELVPVVALGPGPDAPLAIVTPGLVGSRGALGVNFGVMNW